MLAIALAIGLISALTGNDVLGDLNTGTIVDGSGLGGIIGGSGSSTGTGSSPEAPSVTTGGDYVYKPDNTYYKEDLDIVYSYEEVEGYASVVLEFYVPDQWRFLWDIDFSWSGAGDNFPGPCCYTYVLNDDNTGVTDGRWISISNTSSVKSGTFDNIRPSNNGLVRLVIKRVDRSGLSEEAQADFVQNFINSEYTIKVYRNDSEAVG